MRQTVRDDPHDPDPAFAELYASFPDASDLEPWLEWCRAAEGPVLYFGVGTGRLAVPLAAAGVELVGVDAHPGMLERLRVRLPGAELVLARIEDLDLSRRFPLVIGPSGILGDGPRLAAAARHCAGRVAMELMNPHWLLRREHPRMRVLDATPESALIEVDYRGGWTHRARVALIWPERIESRLEECGLTLGLMRGREPDAGLDESPTYFVLARCRSGPGPAGRRPGPGAAAPRDRPPRGPRTPERSARP